LSDFVALFILIIPDFQPLAKNSLPFKGRVGVGMGFSASKHPIPLLASPLKGEENTWLKIGAN
jgi:hypothetical protein